jgi:hypothetical protein
MAQINTIEIMFFFKHNLQNVVYWKMLCTISTAMFSWQIKSTFCDWGPTLFGLYPVSVLPRWCTSLKMQTYGASCMHRSRPFVLAEHRYFRWGYVKHHSGSWKPISRRSSGCLTSGSSLSLWKLSNERQLFNLVWIWLFVHFHSSNVIYYKLFVHNNYCAP